MRIHRAVESPIASAKRRRNQARAAGRQAGAPRRPRRSSGSSTAALPSGQACAIASAGAVSRRNSVQGAQTSAFAAAFICCLKRAPSSTSIDRRHLRQSGTNRPRRKRRWPRASPSAARRTACRAARRRSRLLIAEAGQPADAAHEVGAVLGAGPHRFGARRRTGRRAPAPSPGRAWPSPPGIGAAPGGVGRAARTPARSYAAISVASRSRPDPIAQHGRRGERLLHRDLLVEQHADQQGERVGSSSVVAGVGGGEVHAQIPPRRPVPGHPRICLAVLVSGDQIQAPDLVTPYQKAGEREAAAWRLGSGTCGSACMGDGLTRVRVVGAALVRDGRVLAARRIRPAGGWEFPGGKVEPGETPAAGIERECREELGVVVRVARSSRRCGTSGSSCSCGRPS